MKLYPEKIFEEYRNGSNFKAALGAKGLAEQSKINERFYIGDQWHGAKCGNERPLVRHNIIKRIGDYKISQITANAVTLNYSAEGVVIENNDLDLSLGVQALGGSEEINLIMEAFSKYYNSVSERIGYGELCSRVLRNAYVMGSSVLYTYWDDTALTGFYRDSGGKNLVRGDICCEVLDINDVVFGDPYCADLQKQPYIIISSFMNLQDVIREARLHGADIKSLNLIENLAVDGKVQVLTRLTKKYRTDGTAHITACKVCEKAVIRGEFDTSLALYPLACFSWERKSNCIYGESEVTFLIPNQIAINRMITANVWASMTAGMPMMLVNGDLVNNKITNDPGQIIKVFGTNEDLEGAVKYIVPPSISKDFDTSINTLITNTLTQSGANEVALGDSKADNATALANMRDAALMPLQIVKNRYYAFLEEVARIWADFWIGYYGSRYLKVYEGKKASYIPFDAKRYKGLSIMAKVDVNNAISYTEREKISMLITLFEKGIINREQFLKRIPDGVIADVKSLIGDGAEETV